MANNKTKEAAVPAYEKFLYSVASFFKAQWKKIAIGAGVLILSLLIVVIVSLVNSSRFEKDFMRLDVLQETYASLDTLDETSTEYASTLSELEGSLQELASSSKAYPGLKAEYLLGQLAWNQKDFATAREHYLAVHENGRGIYLGAVALVNAAAASEELGEDAAALGQYQMVADSYGQDIAVAPRALFGEARIYEKTGDIDLARAVFQELADAYPSSEFARIAQNRLLVL
ncbi:tetratricopeptide repeat protein [Parasphaerochaeta coccoides]|uniref:Tetratricopeptide TPR_2 repeat-containing protein n=1 Tax=Parasphaerochaeta coccoides (strain ATCC BAA-1237 / DSM 17374 / SPN1) TaxID=760011 RepID=F4GK70_PARC1|nr:tetratricopeptide repeat protein [Parasphaerochaeta coccoides]AEC01842.1 Tetratricopeptide TPR_2 repeat-containing protein [Parasphaerochaeta coccoides DSM 17374]